MSQLQSRRRSPLVKKSEKNFTVGYTRNDYIANSQSKKAQLYHRLQAQIERLRIVENIESNSSDNVIEALQEIISETKKYDLKELHKMADLAIGKRILTLELEKKKADIQKKIEKKRKIEDYFRENRISKVDYEELTLLKLKENTLIVRPYEDGHGFIQSPFYYNEVISPVTKNKYTAALEHCEYEEVIKKINKIFFRNYSDCSSEKSRDQACSSPILRVSLACLVIIIILCIVLTFSVVPYLEYCIFAVNLVMIVLLVSMAFHSYMTQTSNNGQLDQTISDVKKYLQDLNAENEEKGNKFRWVCPQSFMHLQIVFEQGYEICD